MRLTYRTRLPNHPVQEVFAWHERPGAFERLTPPWADVEIEHGDPGIRDGARVVLRVRQGPASFRWELRHRDYEADRGFRDEQVSGPFKSWSHAHVFRPVDGGGCEIQDIIDLEAPFGLPVGPLYVRRELDRLFAFRHRRLEGDLDRHAQHAGKPRLTVAITGSTGLIGSNLRDFLTTGGHRVVPVLRDRRKLGRDGIFWNPDTGDIDADGLAGVDAVVHLSGVSLASGRWTEARKKVLVDSRIRSTQLMARTLARLARGPRTLVCASAVGYYGNRGDQRLDESSEPGAGFLARLSQDWEAASRPAVQAGIRVVSLRQGVAITPSGGALGQMLLPFKMGIGGRLGSGRQYLSWIDLDDLVAVHLHVLYDASISGPVNATAPNPVTNETFTSALGRVLGRPTLIPLPAVAVKAAFGQLGEEALLWGQRVVPTRLQRAGFRFRYEGVEDSLRHQLGRQAGYEEDSDPGR